VFRKCKIIRIGGSNLKWGIVPISRQIPTKIGEIVSITEFLDKRTLKKALFPPLEKMIS